MRAEPHFQNVLAFNLQTWAALALLCVDDGGNSKCFKGCTLWKSSALFQHVI